MIANIVSIPDELYHADPGDRPSLSASIAKLIVNRSPAHAWAAHPRLNPQFERHEEEKFDLGKAVHALLLEGIDAVTVIDADDWRTKAAREQRDEVRATGRIPLLAKHMDAVTRMERAVREQLERHTAVPPLFTDGLPEQTIFWQENGVICRARLDWLRNDHTAIDDLKTTSQSASPYSWPRSTLFGLGYDIQAAFYLRGLRHITGSDAQFRLAVVETTAPYAVSVFALAPDALALANAKVDAAILRWKTCLERDEWPSYPTDVCHVELPPWEETRFFEMFEGKEAA